MHTTNFEVDINDQNKVLTKINTIKNNICDVKIIKQSDKIILVVHLNDAKKLHKYFTKRKINVKSETDICNNLLEMDNIASLKYFMEQECYDNTIELIEIACKTKKYDAIEIILTHIESDSLYCFLVDKIADLDMKIIKMTLKNLTDWQYLDNNDYSKLLCSSIKNDEMDIMWIILKSNDDIEMRMFYGELLETALENGLEDVSEYLIKYGIESAKHHTIISAELEYYVMHYAKLDNNNMVEILFNVDDYEQEWLDDAFVELENCSSDIVKKFIERGANVEKYGKKLRKRAKKCKNEELVKYLNEYLE